jgi:hypothetical protein
VFLLISGIFSPWVKPCTCLFFPGIKNPNEVSLKWFAQITNRFHPSVSLVKIFTAIWHEVDLPSLDAYTFRISVFVLFVHEYVFPFDSTCVYYPQWVGYCLCFFIRDSNFQSKWLANLLSEIFPTYTVAVFLQIVLFICQYPGVWDEARGAGDCSHDRLFRAKKLRETNWSSNKRRNRLSWIDLPFFLDHCIYLLN